MATRLAELEPRAPDTIHLSGARASPSGRRALQPDLTDHSFVIMKKSFLNIWNFIKRITGFSVPVVGGGVQWKDDPRQNRIKEVVGDYIRLYNDPQAQAHVDPPLILRAGAATLQDNSELEEVCSQIQMRGYRNPLNTWLEHGIRTDEMLDFLKWGISDSRVAKTVLTEKERDEAAARFRKSRQDS